MNQKSVTTGSTRKKWRGADKRTTPGFKAVQVIELLTWNKLQVREDGSRSQEEVSPAQPEMHRKQTPANSYQIDPESPPIMKG